jgi:hypothetical protein
MKFHITKILLPFSLLTASIAPAVAQEVQLSPNTIVVDSGSDLRCRLDKGLRITKAGEPITARLVEPVYIGTVLAIPKGSTIQGLVSSVSTAPWSKRTGRLLNGDFTPPRSANVTFDHLVLSDGNSLPIRTDTTVGVSGLKTAKYLPKSQHSGVRGIVKDAVRPVREPNKLQRLREAALRSLPYHPEYLDQGTIFDAVLLDPITAPVPVKSQADVDPPSGENYLRVRLLTPLKSQMIARGESIEAVVSQPYYNADHFLLYPAGTKLEGTVIRAKSAGWMKRNGALLFSFHSVLTRDGTTSTLRGTVIEVEGAGYQALAIGQEGDIKATTSLLTQLRAPLSLISPSTSLTDSTAWSRAGNGEKGFGLLGAGAAQASAVTAAGFGYYGAAMQIYKVFIAKGSNVDLPTYTPIFLRVNEELQSSSLESVATRAVAEDLDAKIETLLNTTTRR